MCKMDQHNKRVTCGQRKLPDYSYILRGDNMPKNYNAIFDYNLFWPAEYDPSMTYYRQLNFLFEKVKELEARVAELENEEVTNP